VLVANSAVLLMALAAPQRALAQQQPFDLGQLMQTLATVKSGEATFVETRTVNMLDRTLKSAGKLSFEAPDTFVRETLRPNKDRIAVVGNTVTMSMGGRTRTVPLDSVPEAAVIMEAIRGTLTGNREAIERNFDASVTGNAQQWSLTLKPREFKLQQLVTSIRVSGRQALAREVAVAMADGDSSVMAIEPVSSVPSSSASGASGGGGMTAASPAPPVAPSLGASAVVPRSLRPNASASASN
jgi:outer membrane lipoprotein-sorting protein